MLLYSCQITPAQNKFRLRSCLQLMLLLSFALPFGAQAKDDREQLLKRIQGFEQRVIELETSTVLSDPETRVKRIEVFVDDRGIEHDTQVPGSKRIITYQRERVYRRQTINEKIEEALDDAARRNVRLGVDAAIILQNVQQTRGNDYSCHRQNDAPPVIFSVDHSGFFPSGIFP